MTTFQLAGLPSMQVANQNAPGQPSLSNYDFSQRPNVGVQLAQGLGAVGQEIQQNEAAKKLSDFQKAFGQAYAAGDRDALRQLAATNPDQIETIRQGMGFVDADRNQAMGDMSARLNIAAAQGPEAVMRELVTHQNTLQQIGISPEQAWQTYQQSPEGFTQLTDLIGMHAVGPEKYFDIQDKLTGREIDRGRLAETIRSNQAGEALQARGQDISASNSAADRQIRLMQLKQDALVKQANRETNDLKRQELQLKIDANQQALQEKRQQVQKGKDMSYEAAKLARSIASNPQLDVVTGSIQSRLPKFDGESLDIINQAQQLQSMLTAGNLGLLKGAMSDKDIAFLQSMSSGLNVGDNGIKGSYEATKKKLNIIADKLERNLGGYVPEGEPASAGTQSPQAATTKSWSDLP